VSARPLCDPCAEAWMRWLDYRPRQPIALITPGRTSVRDVLQAQKFRADDARDLIRSQQALIRDICERNHHQP
jgi:hypothetical protein